jgi:phospholipid/cholesterol/gamma-HCH transport system ATP-binding protein
VSSGNDIFHGNAVSSGGDLIHIRGVRKRYEKKEVHRGIDLTVKKGEVLTLMGGSGTGKSVLLRCIIGLERPDSGSIYFHGVDVTKLREEELVDVRRRIAYVFQYGALFDSFTVFENLAYPLREHTDLDEDAIRERVAEALAQVGLAGSEQLLPSDLSGGMQRRVGVARAIILEPEVILYDEPTTGLDPYNTKQILRIILQLQKQGATSVLVTHDMHSIFEVTDRVAFLRGGVIQALGSAKEIQESPDPELQGFIRGETP